MFTLMMSSASLLVSPGAMRQDAADFAQSVEKAHGATSYRAQEMLRADLVVAFGGTTMIDGVLYFDIDSECVRIEQPGKPTLVWDGEKAWVADGATSPGARFHLRTWTYFLAVPFKLRDPGAHLSLHETLPLQDGETYATARLTFGENVGDAPDDWYIVYRDRSNRLKAMSYIVTYTEEVETAEKEPHAIVYDGFKTVDGVTFSTEWTFYNWSAETGATGEPLGNVTVKNIRFEAQRDELFTKPANATEDVLPGNG